MQRGGASAGTEERSESGSAEAADYGGVGVGGPSGPSPSSVNRLWGRRSSLRWAVGHSVLRVSET